MSGPHSQLLFTPEGKRELAAEVASLEETRRDILRESERSSGPSRSALRNELDVIDEQIRRLRHVLASGSLIENTGIVVAVGSEVTIVDEEGKRRTFTIGGPLAASPHFACLSYESPTGRAVLGHELGDVVEVESAQGLQRWRIVELRSGRSEPTRGPTLHESTIA